MFVSYPLADITRLSLCDLQHTPRESCQPLFRVFLQPATFRRTCRAGSVRQHYSDFNVVFQEGMMPETLESLLWCAALATWLMLFFGFISERLKSLPKFVSRLLEGAFRLKAK